jgi:hypothetical protein
MRKTITTSLALVCSLLCILILGACPPGAGTDTSDKKIGQVIITNIPLKVREDGPESFKIYVQLSTSMSDSDPHTAISSGKIEKHKNQDGSVTLSLYEDQEMTTPWEGSGSFYIAVTISPKNAPSAEAIRVKVPSSKKNPFSSEANTIDWNTSIDLEDLVFFAAPRIQAIYNRIIKVDPDINTNTEQ